MNKEKSRRKAASLRGKLLLELLSREDFQRLCFQRSKGLCVLCSGTAVDAHHIFDRKLFPDGGYRLNNAAALCSACHWRAETCAEAVPAILAASAISEPLIPPHAAALGLASAADCSRLDKWGNMIRADGSVAPGPLFHDDGCRKALADGGRLALCYEAGDFPWSEAG